MTLYEIDQQIMSCVDMDTGEIIDMDKLSELQIERETKLENIALWIKNLKAEEAALKAEKDAFAKRENKAKIARERLSEWLTEALNGNKFSTAKVDVSFRKSEAVEVNEGFVPKKWMVKKISFTPDKIAIKNAIKQGAKIRGCALVERNNIQIK